MPERLPTMEEFWLTRAEKVGGVPFDLWRPTCERLLARGWLTQAGEITPAGAAALAADRERAEEDAMRRNILPSISARLMMILGKLIRGEELTAEEVRACSCVELVGALDRGPNGYTVTDHGRKAYSLASGRTY